MVSLSRGSYDGDLQGAVLEGAHDGGGGMRAEAFAGLREGALKVGALAMPEAVATALVALHFLAFDIEDSRRRVRGAHAPHDTPDGRCARERCSSAQWSQVGQPRAGDPQETMIAWS